MRAERLVERRHFVSLAEVPDSFPYCLHIPRDVISLVQDSIWLPFGDFPILRVGTRHHYPDEDLAGFGSGDVNVADDDRNGLVDNGFFHFATCDLRLVTWDLVVFKQVSSNDLYEPWNIFDL